MDPPLGLLPGLVWDAERQRYFRPKRPVAVEATEGGGEEDVAARPVDKAVASRLKRRKRAESPCAVCFEVLGRSGLLREAFFTHLGLFFSTCWDVLEAKDVVLVKLRGSKPVVLPCQHLFHSRCLAPWMQRTGSCPVCRKPIDTALDTAQRAALERWQASE